MDKIGTILITGASSGLGAEYFKHIAGSGDWRMHDVWLIARDGARMQALAERYPQIRTTVIPLDLADSRSFETLREMLETRRPEVYALINNAGFGLLGDLIERDYPEQADIVNVNCRAATAVTCLALPYMQRGGFVLNTCSIASFAPNPRMTVYSASKAFLFHFSKSLRYELKPRGIHVCAVCPGPMETAFLDVADIPGNSKTFATLPYCDPAAVARRALEYARAGRGVYTPRLFYKFYRLLAKILPHGLLLPLTKT